MHDDTYLEVKEAADTITSVTPPVTDPLASAPKPVNLRRFGDHNAAREAIFSNALNAVSSIKPVENSRYRLEIGNLGYVGHHDIKPSDEKKALMTDQTLSRRLVGDMKLIDKSTNNVVDNKRTTIAHVPYLTNRGLFIMDGNQSILSSQQRLDPGIYARKKASGEIESHVNVAAGQGISHRIRLDPETGVFKIDIGQAEIPIMAMLGALGASNDELDKAWGKELTAANIKAAKPHHLDRLWEKMGTRGPVEDKAKALSEIVNKFKLDPWTTKRTLGKSHATYSKDAVLDATSKLLKIARGETEPDDRDSMVYSSLWAPEHLIADSLARSQSHLNQALWQATNQGSLKNIQPGVISPAVRSLFLNSGLAIGPEGSHGTEFVDHGARITKVGAGGISRSADAIPKSARDVSPSQLGFVDLSKASESTNVGVDGRVAFGVKTGDDHRLYAPFRHIKSNKITYVSPRDLADSTIGFPGTIKSKNEYVPAIKDGRLLYAKKSEVDFELPTMEQSFSPISNLVPMKSADKAQRASMGSRFAAQALPLLHREAPYVRNEVPGQPGTSFHEVYGKHMGPTFADKSGTVSHVDNDEIHIKHDDGTESVKYLWNNLPAGRKVRLHSFPLVQTGDKVGANQILSSSNFTDNKGHAAYGLNARVAFIPYIKPKHGYSTYEDSIGVSETAAKKFTSDHLFVEDHLHSDTSIPGKAAYLAAFPGKYKLDMLKNYDDDGAIKVGQVVNSGEPLVLGVKRRQDGYGVGKSAKSALADSSVLWDHDESGVVTDVYKTNKGTRVAVNTQKALKEGDKLCYDGATDVLTKNGWKNIKDISVNDKICTLLDGEKFDYINPASVQSFMHKGPMYHLETTQVDLLVTDNHKLYAKPRYRDDFGLYEAKDLFGKRYRLKKNGVWKGNSPKEVIISGVEVKAGQSGNGVRTTDDIVMSTKTYMMLLGLYLSEGNTFNDPKAGNYGFEIHQVKPHSKAEIKEALDEAGIKYTVAKNGCTFRIYSKNWLMHLPKKLSYEKYIPNHLFDWDKEDLEVLYYWLMLGDGCQTGTGHSYVSTSRQLAEDVQRLALHIGMSANIDYRDATTGVIKGKKYNFRKVYYVRIYRFKNNPEINHGHVKTQGGQIEEWVDYEDNVYCVTMPKGHVIYVRRNDKTVWCANSGFHGNKGVVSIIPDHLMPQGEDGRPLEVVYSTLGLVSRCYDADTEFLTRDGWKKGADVNRKDELMAYDTSNGNMLFSEQIDDMFVNDFDGQMFKFDAGHADFMVTPGHKVWARQEHNRTWRQTTVDNIYGNGKRWYIPTIGNNEIDPNAKSEDFTLPHLESYWRVKKELTKEIVIPALDWAALLGWYIAEGHYTKQKHKSGTSSGSTVHIAQSREANPEKCRILEELLNRLPFGWHYNKGNKSYVIHSTRLGSCLSKYGKSHEKYVDEWVFRQPYEVRQAFLDAYWLGDGNITVYKRGAVTAKAGTTSRRLADDLQRLIIYQGHNASVRLRKRDNRADTYTRPYRPMWSVQIALQRKEISLACRKTSHEGWSKVDYKGKVYCPSVSTGYVMVRRNGKICILGNTNPAHIIESALGKVAEKTGKPYVIRDFDDIQNLAQFAHRELQKHGLKDKETLYDPETGVSIPNVATGNMYIAKLSHMSEGKAKGRGALGGYDESGRPLRGQSGKAQRMSMGDTSAILNYGSGKVLHDLKNFRGQANDEMWLSYMSGYPLKNPGVNKPYERFLEMLKGVGVNPVRDGDRVQLMGMKQSDLDSLTEDREIQNAETLDFSKEGRPVPKGLFDTDLTGGPDGCFHYDTKILTDNGPVSIGDIVESELPVNVLSYDWSKSSFVFKPVVNWFKNNVSGLGRAKLKHASSVSAAKTPSLAPRSSYNAVWATPLHSVYDDIGNKLNIKDAAYVMMAEELLTDDQLQVLYGGALGDSFIAPDGYLHIRHTTKQEAYLRFKADVFRNLFTDKSISVGRHEAWNKQHEHISFNTRSSPGIMEARNLCYPNGAKQVSQEWLDKIDALGLAIWYQDDGCLSKVKGYNKQKVVLCTEGFNKKSVYMIADWLRNKWQLQCSIYRGNKKYGRRDMGWQIHLSKEASSRFLKLVAPYIVKSMQYKLGNPPLTDKCSACNATITRQRNVCDVCRANKIKSFGASKIDRSNRKIFGNSNKARAWADSVTMCTEPKETIEYADLLLSAGSKLAGVLSAIPEVPPMRLIKTESVFDFPEGDHRLKIRTAYDIEVADNHNYFANGVLVSNSKWSKITLHEPHLNPVFEDPTRRLLGLTENKFRDVIAGKEKLYNKTGMEAIKYALDNINVEGEIKKCRDTLATGKKTAKEEAARKLGYLKGVERTGVKPSDWFLNAVPVLPPTFRPIRASGFNDSVVVSDPNLLYKDLFELNKVVKELHGKVDLGDEKLALYDAFKAVTGLGDPISTKNVQKGVKGLLRDVIGTSSKYSFVQQKLLGSSADLSGRGVIVPNPDLDMDSIGVPEELAWDLFNPFIVRRLVRQGIPKIEAMKMSKERSDSARKAMIDEMGDRIVTATRYPVLHKFGVQAFRPQLVSGSSIQLGPLNTKGFGADYDGNCCVYNSKIFLEIILDFHSFEEYLLNLSQEDISKFKEWYMSVTSNETVSIKNGNVYTTCKIGELPQLGEATKDKNGADIYMLPPNIKVLSYDHETGKAEYKDIVQLTVEQDAECVLVKTRHGYEVEVSDNESLCVFDNETGKLVKMAPKDAIGKFVPRVSKAPEVGNEYDFDLGWLYGALVADGWVTDRTVGYSKNDVDKRLEVTRIMCDKYSDIDFKTYEYIEEKNEKKFADSAKIHMNSAELAANMFSMYADAKSTGRSALIKKLPDEILHNGSREALLGLLSGLLDGDAYIGWNTAMANKRFVCRLNTSSPHLRDSIVTLGSKLGFRAFVTTSPANKSRAEAYAISLSIPDIWKLAKEIKLIGEQAKADLAEFAARTQPKDDADLVPLSTSVAKELMHTARKLKDSPLYCSANSATRENKCSRSTARRLADLADKAGLSTPEINNFKIIARAEHIQWEEVTEVVETGKQEVFDLVVPDTKVFVINGGIVIYDTMTMHVILSDEAKREAEEKMLPSRNLISPGDFKSPVFAPNMEFVQGLHHMSSHEEDNDPIVFNTIEEAMEAKRQGKISYTTRIEIRDKAK